MMKLLHLSDLHIGKQATTLDEKYETNRIVRSIIAKWGGADDKPIVVITGDIVDDGLEEQYQLARQCFLPLRQLGFQLVFAPGNHDYGREGSFALARNFKLFKKYLHGIRDRVTYPDVPFETEDLTLITLNSMKAETGLWDGLLADGELGQKQLDNLGELIRDLRAEYGAEHTIAVALHHHPFLYPDDSKFHAAYEWLGHRLKDGADFMTIVEGKIDILLFGHEHRHVNFAVDFPSATLTTKYGIPVILSNGKSTEPGHPARLIEIDKSKGFPVEEATGKL
jgi:3',5'-cyclic AMP phosphodiesterase CpdA